MLRLSNNMSTTTLNAFTFSPSLTPYNIPPANYLAAHPTFKGLIVSAVVIHKNRVLLIQRAPHDGFPLKWECPGGGVDQTDATILHAVCREVHEETGLGVTHIADVVDILEFEGGGSDKGTLWRKITFLVGLDPEDLPEVRLDAEEHVDAVWASEGDVLAGKAEGRDIEFAYDEHKQTILDVLRRAGGNAEGSLGKE
jgi:8-oxo-dGTP pyrophosphatase MutT (NUDIX family)